MEESPMMDLEGYPDYTEQEMLLRVQEFYDEMRTRRSVRDYAPDPVPREVMEACLGVAGTAPSGAHMQPWHFVAVSDPEVKRQIRAAAEERERAFYERLAGEEWLQALAPLGTGWEKPFLSQAPWLICVFAQRSHQDADGQTIKHYYVHESVGIALGFLIAALHRAGLASLVYTPTRPSFLNALLGRPASERPYAILVVGHPAPDAQVPDQGRKPLSEVATFVQVGG